MVNNTNQGENNLMITRSMRRNCLSQQEITDDHNNSVGNIVKVTRTQTLTDMLLKKEENMTQIINLTKTRDKVITRTIGIKDFKDSRITFRRSKYRKLF